ncbi:hypothetical protein TNCT_211111 [Trichonephila clavata]|uniref:Uncharacterized protein n=1 Tax=Trichonephila clavata TaxID=2740835 RepID=A0A8X6JME6_TRICU|nr:hypothetical protein TNCT_211111 [Trichonephila clavata]
MIVLQGLHAPSKKKKKQSNKLLTYDEIANLLVELFDENPRNCDSDEKFLPHQGTHDISDSEKEKLQEPICHHPDSIMIGNI